MQNAYSSLLTLELKPLIIDQRTTFYRQRIPESSCARKEIVHKHIYIGFVTENHATY